MLRPATLLLIALFACGPAAASDRDPLAGAVPIEAVAAGLPSLDDLSGRTLQHAVDAFSRGELRAARGELRTLLDRQRVVGAERVQAHFLLGWISTQMGHHQQASANFYRVRKLEQHPLRELAAFYEARADLNRGHPRTAIAECEQYRTEYPEGRFVEECALVSAESHLALGQLKIAIDAYEAFLEEHPDDQRREAISLKIADALEQDGRFEAAANRYRTLYVHHRLPTTGGVAAAGLQRLEATGVDLPELNDQELYVRACSLRSAGMHDASYDLYCELDDRNPGAGDGATDLGRRLDQERHDFLWRNRQYEAVGEEAARRYHKDPQGAEAAEDLYWAFQGFSRSGRFDDAVKYHEIGARDHGKHRRFRGGEERAALLYVGAGRYAEAVDAYRAWQAKSSRARRSHKTRFLVAYMLYKAERLDESIEELTKLLRSDRYGDAALFWRARAYERAEEWKLARADFKQLGQGYPDSWYTLVQELRRARQAKERFGGRWRDGRWPGLAARDAALPVKPGQTPISEGVARAFGERYAGEAVLGVESAAVRDGDGRLHPARFDGWSSRGVFTAPAMVPARPVDPLPPASVEHIPSTWQPSPWWDAERGRELWKEFVDEHAEHWPELPTAYDLSLIGLGELAGPMLARIYVEVRDVRRSASKKRRVARWRAAGGGGGTDEVARWAAIVDLNLRAEDWRQLFASAGYPASVSAFATESIRYRGLERTGEGRGAWTLRFPAAFAPHVWRHSWENDVDPLLMLSIMRAESLFRHDAVSSAGALGLVQVMPATGARVAALAGDADFRVEQLLVPEENIRLGTFYLGRLLDRFAGQFPLAVGSYNGGPHNIGRWLRPKVGMPFEEFVEEIAFDETRHYVKKVTSYYTIYTELYAPGDQVLIPGETSADDPTVINF